MHDRMTLANLLRRKMVDYDFTSIASFAKFIGLTEKHLCDLMLGRQINPGQEVRRRICRALDIAPKVLDMAVRYSLRGGNTDANK